MRALMALFTYTVASGVTLLLWYVLSGFVQTPGVPLPIRVAIIMVGSGVVGVLWLLTVELNQ